MAKPRNKYRDYGVYLGLRLFAALVEIFGCEVNYRTARWIGGLLYRFDRRHRRRAVGHLRLSFPHWSRARCRQVAASSIRHMVYFGLELLLTPRRITPTAWRRHIRLVNMTENLRLMIERDTALIYVAGHFSQFEIPGYTMAALGFPVTAIARKLDNPYIDAYVRRIRQAGGLTILDKKGAVRFVDGILARRGSVSFIADQDAGRRGLFVDFFGRPASTYKSIALMAMRHDAPIVVAYARRLDEGFHFEIGIQRIIYPNQWGEKDDPVRWITQEYTTALEEVIRKAPHQYLWVHRRWKRQPGDGPRGKDGIA